MDYIPESGKISIQVSLSGFSFKISTEQETVSSGWLSQDRLFSTPELSRCYRKVEISVFTSKCTMVPESFFSPEEAENLLAGVVRLDPSDKVQYTPVPAFGAVMIWASSVPDSLIKAVAGMVSTTSPEPSLPRPELYYIVSSLEQCKDYNRIVASYKDGYLHLAIAQGRNLLLSNVFEAADFTTAEYFIFLTMRKLQMNPEVSTICFRTPVSPEEEMSLYRYFKAVEQF